MNTDTVAFVMVVLFRVATQFVVMGVLGVTIERFWPADPRRPARDGMNLIAYVLWFSVLVLLQPVISLFGTMLMNRFGSGFIALPANGWAIIGGFLLYLAAMDFGEYAYHRLQHEIPWLWSIHSLHHSDEHFDATTGVRHHFTAHLIRALAVITPLGMVFKVPPLYVALYSFVSLHGYLIHANVRLDFGRLSWLWTSPSYHRLHHSREPEHLNRNYASMLPLWDIVFGTYRPAKRGEWPAVGLDDGDNAGSLLDLVIWPVRGLVRGANVSTTN